MTKHKRRAKGEGGLRYDEARGLWIGSVSYLDDQGKRQRPKVTAKTKPACVEKLDALKVSLRQGMAPAPSDRLTLSEYLHQWLTDVVQPSKAPRTYRSYEEVLHNYIEPSMGRVPLKELTPRQAPKLQGLLNRLHKRGLSARTVRYSRDVLRAALNQAMRWGLVTSNVATLVEPPKQVKHSPVLFTHEEALRFLDAVRGDRLEALYTVALTLGLRCGEAVGLRWEDIDLDAGTLSITGQIVRVPKGGGRLRTDAKTSGSHRTLMLPRSCIAALQRRRDNQQWERRAARDDWQDTGYVFTTRNGGPFEPRAINRFLARILEKAGLPHMGPHGLRHSAGSILHAQGESLKTISTLLGHSSIRITADLYTHIGDQSKRELADRMDDIYGDSEDIGATIVTTRQRKQP